MRQTIWIGLFELTPWPDNEELEQGWSAFANIVGYVCNKDEFIRNATAYCRENKYNVASFEDEEIEELAQRVSHARVHPDLLAAARSLDTPNECIFDQLDAYPDEHLD